MVKIVFRWLKPFERFVFFVVEKGFSRFAQKKGRQS